MGRYKELWILFVLCSCSTAQRFILDAVDEPRADLQEKAFDSDTSVLETDGILVIPSQERTLDLINEYLTQILLQPQANGPTLFVKSDPPLLDFGEDATSSDYEQDVFVSPMKRSRYYRKHPWRRAYKARDNDRIICSPSKEDIFRLLVALHEIRKGKGEQIVNICSKKRPVHVVFSNIRSSGKRK